MYILESVLILSSLTVVGAIQCYNSSEIFKDFKCKSIEISCPENHVIYKPNIQATNQPCGSPSSCYDRPVEMMLDIAECYWKQSCRVQYPRSQLISCRQNAKSVKVFDWQCVDSSEVPHRINELICDGRSDFGSDVQQGIIRSHAEIPWRYDQNTFSHVPFKPGDIGEHPIQCRKTIHPRPGTTDRYLVSVDLNLIDQDNDKLTINGTSIGKDPYHQVFDGTTPVDIQFKKSFVSKGGSGFVICFRKLQAFEDVSDVVSACNSMITKTHEPVKEILSGDQCPAFHDMLPFDGEDSDDVCADILSGHNRPVSKNTTDTQMITDKTGDQDSFCVTCLAKKKVGKKCKKSCCKGPNQPKKCKKRKRRNKCPKGKKLTHFCSKCEVKCRKNIQKKCMKCCKSNDQVIKKCKKRKGRKGRKGKKGGKRRKNRNG